MGACFVEPLSTKSALMMLAILSILAIDGFSKEIGQSDEPADRTDPTGCLNSIDCCRLYRV